MVPELEGMYLDLNVLAPGLVCLPTRMGHGEKHSVL